MIRFRVGAIGVLIALAGCATDELVDIETTRPAATVVDLDKRGRCPSDTVMLLDDDPASGAGAIPADFTGVRVLRCFVDYTTMMERNGVERYTVRQWEQPLTPQLGTAFTLPDRDFRRGRRACAAGSAGTTAIYVADGEDRAVRVLPPTEQPCDSIRSEVRALLPDSSSTADQTFTVERASQ